MSLGYLGVIDLIGWGPLDCSSGEHWDKDRGHCAENCGPNQYNDDAGYCVGVSPDAWYASTKSSVLDPAGAWHAPTKTPVKAPSPTSEQSKEQPGEQSNVLAWVGAGLLAFLVLR